jgi:2-C-methyl-D-erythritol 4-phosphate cytidylyltransferase/2-C-methyl-D-erythritol 2,4-cyclodiphosphate synthase
MHVTAIIAAAGLGRRLGSPTPKQFLTLGGLTVLERAVRAFDACPRITDMVVVTHREAVDQAEQYLPAGGKPVSLVVGGATRQESVGLGFAGVPPGAEYIVVHDAARPFVTCGLIERTLDAAIESGAAIAALPSPDTVKELETIDDRLFVRRTIPRDAVYLAQTPQAFRKDILADAVARGRGGAVATDEAGLVELAGYPVRLVEGDAFNVKITTERDLPLARGILGDAPATAWRTGTGYDLHRLVEGRPLVIGGVRIESARGALGHSDADVACHAITDAVLGAARAGDIGQRYPDTDERWKGARSLDLLRDAAGAVQRDGFVVENVDVVVILERPKLAPYREAMQALLAEALGVDAGRVSVKAKTNEGVDAVGRGEAIAAHAVALLRCVRGHGGSDVHGAAAESGGR